MLDPNVMTCLPHVVEIDGAPVRLREEKYMRSALTRTLTLALTLTRSRTRTRTLTRRSTLRSALTRTLNRTRTLTRARAPRLQERLFQRCASELHAGGFTVTSAVRNWLHPATSPQPGF